MKKDRPGLEMHYRDPGVIEGIVGRQKKAVQIGTGFWEWPLWKAYPTWTQWQERIALTGTATNTLQLR